MTGETASETKSSSLIRLGQVNRVLETGLAYLAGVCLGALVVIVFIDVLFRQVFNEPLLWPSEIAVILFLWSVMSAAAVSARRRAHFVVDVLPNVLPLRLDFALRLVVVLFGLLFAWVILYYGIKMAGTGLQRYTPMKGYPMIFHFAAFPVAGIAILMFILQHLWEVLTGTDPRGEWLRADVASAD